jgi:tetratricopeptide (TPR) repeat protein
LALCLSAGPLWAQEPTPSRREVRALAEQARALLNEGRFAESARAWEAALRGEVPAREQRSWWTGLGRAQEGTRNYQQALAAYQEAQRLAPRDVDRMTDLARVYALVDLNDRALSFYEQAQKREPRRADILLARAVLYQKIGRQDDARRAAESYAAVQPQDVAGQELLARLDVAEGRLADAAGRWERILAVSPTAAAEHELGVLWARQDQWDRAASAFDRAAARGWSGADFDFERGVAAWRLGRTGQARERWGRSLRTDPGYGPSAFLLALTDWEAGRRSEAVERLRAIRPTLGAIARDWCDILLKVSTGENK